LSAIPTKVRAAVRFREFNRCLVCSSGNATDIHHRMRRREGGHSLSVCILLCRTDHEKVHANPTWARERGLIVPTWRDASTVPVKGWRGWNILDDEGGLELVTDSVAVSIIEG
jgi:hypothetical protein